MTAGGTLITTEKVAPICRLGRLIEVCNCKAVWNEKGCEIEHPVRGRLPSWMEGSCPVVEEALCLELIDELEHRTKQGLLRRVFLAGSECGMQSSTSRSPGESLGVDDMLKALKQLCPEAPDRVLARVPPWATEFTGEQLPFNRRMRRAVEKARKVVIHVYSGDTKSKDLRMAADVAVLSVDLKHGANMLNDATYSYLLGLIANGKVDAIVGGPPCPTVSRLRDRASQDGGPRRLRAREGPQSYGIEDLTASEQKLTDDHSVLLLRMLMMQWVAEDVSPEKTLFALEHPEDPCTYLKPHDLVKGCEAVEGPRDPTKPPSIWMWPEIQEFARQYSMWIADFDQYPFGHQRPKPTSLLTNSWTLYKTLQNVRCSPEELQCLKQRPLPELGQRMEQSRAWGKWAPGLCRAIGEACTAWVLSKREQRESEAQEDQAMLAKLSSEEESFIQHCEQDHVCFRPDCRVCLSGAIRSHQHARSKYPQRNALTLTADLIGPLVPAEDQAHKQVKHLLIAALTVPAYEGGTLKQLAEGKDVEDALIPEVFELDQDGAQSGGADADPTEFAFEDQGETVGEGDSGVEESEGPKTPEPSMNSKASKESERREARWKEELKTLRKPVKVKHLVFAVPVPTKRASAILKAIQYIYCRIRQLGLSVRRLHTDNGREFSNQLLDGWCEARDIYHTTSVPSDPRSNGLAEAFVNLAKCGIRTLLDSAKAPKTDWPHAARHWAEARLQRCFVNLDRLRGVP